MKRFSSDSDTVVGKFSVLPGEYSVVIDVVFHMLGIHPFSLVEIGKSFSSGIIDLI